MSAPSITIMDPAYVHFPAGSARFTKASFAILERMAKMLRKAPAGNRIRIEGHCDRTEKGKAVLSLKRARYVRNYLIKKGVRGVRMKAVGLGSTSPIASSESAHGRMQNRRVEFTPLADL